MHVLKFAALAIVFVVGESDALIKKQGAKCGPNRMERTADEVVSVWPWHVALYNSTMDYIAGGSIINVWFVLTAAHATFHDGRTPMQPDELAILAGFRDLRDFSDDAQEYEVGEIIRYPLYNLRTRMHDVALLRVSTEIELNFHVAPICLWPEGGPTLELLAHQQEQGTVVGWGLSVNGTFSNVLRETSLSLIGFESCAEHTKSFQPLLAKGKNFCAGNRGGASVCKGDSGGGMHFLIDGIWYIRGIVNQGTPTQDTRYLCDPRKDVLFMDVTYYRKWIERHAAPERHNLLALSECGMGYYDETNVRHNKFVQSERHPWIAHLYYSYQNRINVSDCHGVLIHPEFVLAPARCVSHNPDRKLLQVILGEELIGPDPSSLDYNFQAIKVSEVFMDGRFDVEKYGYDVSILHLARSVEIGNNSRPVCLPSLYEQSPYFNLAAWYRRDNHPKELKSVLMRPIRFNFCSAQYRAYHINITEQDRLNCFQHCEMSEIVQSDGTHSCEYSEETLCRTPISGAPLFYTKHDGINTYTYLFGMRSFGVANCSAKMSEVFSDVIGMGKWIKHMVRKHTRSSTVARLG
ncbi:polyserase-2-like [Aedes albopictus]|uniref:Peptidase S1 domain-containing protein n=1 Tax=Aedes albopictus TaxID=7160 RepID=A0ABM1YP72_AEDAL